MRWHLVAGLLLTGCALQPVAHSPALPDGPVESSSLPLLTLAPRVGIEYLPPLEDPRTSVESPHAPRASRPAPRVPRASRETALADGRFADLTPALEPLRPPGTVDVSPIGGEDRTGPTPPSKPESSRAAAPWHRTDAELALIEDPVERLTLSLLSNIVGTERRRVQRELGASILFTRLRTVSTSHRLDTIVDERDREDQEALFRQYGTGLLRRPLLKTLKQNSFVADVELALEEFKAATFPFAEEYEDTDDPRNPGTISLRLRSADASDLEILYRRRGWRIGTSEERLRITYTVDLSAKVSFSVRSRFDYATDDLDMWGDLRYDPSPDTRLHVLVGKRLDLLTGANLFPVIQSPVVMPAADDSPGVLIYVEHFF